MDGYIDLKKQNAPYYERTIFEPQKINSASCYSTLHNVDSILNHFCQYSTGHIFIASQHRLISSSASPGFQRDLANGVSKKEAYGVFMTRLGTTTRGKISSDPHTDGIWCLAHFWAGWFISPANFHGIFNFSKSSIQSRYPGSELEGLFWNLGRAKHASTGSSPSIKWSILGIKLR